MSKKFLAIAIILGLVIIAQALYLFKNQFVSPNSESHTVMLTEDGFSPEDLTINKGDAIVFATNRNQPFWPASNLHPTHQIYPEFDPREPIEPDKSWQFTFTKVGNWKYHDHLAPLYKGVIKVEDKKTRAASCKNVQCWEDLIDKTLKAKGLTEAFEVLANFYQNEPQFAADCHGLAHILGEKAYEQFLQNKDLAFSTKSSYCGYGFYHGFMENLLHTSGDIKEAQDFCRVAGERLKEQTSDASGACYHGIGHGAVEDVSDPKLWGDSQKIIQPSLDLCEKVSSSENPPQRYGKLFRCVSGVFNALEIVTTQRKYNLSHRNDDPFAICRAQKEIYKEACYTQFVVAAMNVAKGDASTSSAQVFDKAAKYIDTIPEDEYAIPTLQSLAVELARRDKVDYQKTVNFCRDLPYRFRISCITAVAEGFLKYGPPQQEYVKAINFCESEMLTDDEKKACFARILSILRIWYTAEKSQEICRSVDTKYQWNNCQYR